MADPIKASDLPAPRRKPRQRQLGRHLRPFSSMATTTDARTSNLNDEGQWVADASGFLRPITHPANPYVPGDFPFYKFRDDVKLASAESLNVNFLPRTDRESEARFVQNRIRSGTSHFTKEQRAEFERMIAPGGPVYREFQGVENRKIHQRRRLQTFSQNPIQAVSRVLNTNFRSAWLSGIEKRRS